MEDYVNPLQGQSQSSSSINALSSAFFIIAIIQKALFAESHIDCSMCNNVAMFARLPVYAC